MTTTAEWNKYYASVLKYGPEYALKFANSAARLKTHALEIEKKRHTSIFLITKPNARTKICPARLMNGKQCTSKATCGDYCKKHSI